MSEFLYEVGDTFEGGPIYLQRFIGEILGVGGEFDYDGNIVTLTYLPQDYEKIEAPSIPEPVVEAEPQPVAAEEVVEAEPESEPVVEAAPEPVAEAFEEEVAIAPEPKPKGRPRKVAAESTK